MTDTPMFRAPLIDEATLAKTRERNRQLVEALETLTRIECSPHETRESRRLTREAFFRQIGITR